MSSYQINDYFNRNFKKLFATTTPVISEQMICGTSLCVSEEENSSLLRIPMEEEIRECIWNMHPLKAPSPDGFLGDFFRSYWNTIKDQVVWLVE